jgi:hypothetical protein
VEWYWQPNQIEEDTMRSVFAVAFILAVFVLVSADVYTECDYGRLNSTKGVYLGTLAGYNTASNFFDNNGDSHSGINHTYTQIPIRAGFAFNPYWTAYFLLPLGQISADVTATDGTVSNVSSDFGLSNPWLVAKWVRPSGSGFYLGPRLGFRFPFASSTDENAGSGKLAVGDKNFAIDLGAVGRSQPESRSFRLDTSVGIRYYMDATYDIAGTSVKKQPGMFYYIMAEPGFAWGRAKDLATYVVLRFEGSGDSKTDGSSNSNASFHFDAGLKQDWMMDDNNCLELRGVYTVMGKNYPQYIQIALGYNGIIPTK